MKNKRPRLIFTIGQKFCETCWNFLSLLLKLTSGLRFFYWPVVHLCLLLYDFGTWLCLISYLWTWKAIAVLDMLKCLRFLRTFYCFNNSGPISNDWMSVERSTTDKSFASVGLQVGRYHSSCSNLLRILRICVRGTIKIPFLFY